MIWFICAVLFICAAWTEGSFNKNAPFAFFILGLLTLIYCLGVDLYSLFS